LSAHKGPAIRGWAKNNKVELFHPRPTRPEPTRSRPTSGRYGSSPSPTPSIGPADVHHHGPEPRQTTGGSS
jgi:hypothetical protein